MCSYGPQSLDGPAPANQWGRHRSITANNMNLKQTEILMNKNFSRKFTFYLDLNKLHKIDVLHQK
jgi:hypothetical protein